MAKEGKIPGKIFILQLRIQYQSEWAWTGGEVFFTLQKIKYYNSLSG